MNDARDPWLSIVMPVLDEASIVEAALLALAPLRADGAEVIVADGGSRDCTAAIAGPLADRVVVAARGRARQMNAGAAAARGRVLLFLHVDTALPADAVESIRLATTADSSSTQAPRWGRFDVRIDGVGRMFAVVAAMMNLRSRLTGIATGDQAMFADRGTFERVGGYPDQPLMEDVELSKRLRRVAAPICLRTQVVTSGRRWQVRGMWPTILLMWRLRLLYRLGVAPERLARRYV